MRSGSSTGLAMAAVLASGLGCQKRERVGREASIQLQADAAPLPEHAQWGDLTVRLRGAREAPTHALVLLHGWGAPGDDLVPLSSLLEAPGRLLVFPEAPLVSPGGGRAWWHLDIARIQAAIETGQHRDLRCDIPDGLATARAAMQSMLDELCQKSGLSFSDVTLGGFSQGAMLSTDVALHVPSALRALVVLSGTLLAEPLWDERLTKSSFRGPVFMSHGRFDPILPFAMAEGLKEKLERAGHAVSWQPFAGAHEIPMPVIEALQAFLFGSTAH
jgi:phospholipase/carboxylesterase